MGDVHTNEVTAFLADIKLDKYKENFISNGVEDLETILELKDEHIEQMGIPLGHKLKIVKKIKDIRGSKGLTTPQSREGTHRKLNNQTEVTTNHSSSMSQMQPKSSLKEGHFDEKESHG